MFVVFGELTLTVAALHVATLDRAVDEVTIDRHEDRAVGHDARDGAVEFVAEIFFFEQLQHEEGAQVFFGVVSGNFAFARMTTELEELRVIERAWIIEHLTREGAMLLTACG